MRISLIGLIAGGHSGIPRYAAALIEAIDGVAGEFGDLGLTLVTTPAAHEGLSLSGLDVERVRGGTRGASRSVAEQMAAARTRADLLHFFDLTGPVLARRRRFVATIHDAAVRRGSEQTWSAHKRLLQPLAVRRAARIVAVSDFARSEAIEVFGADTARLRTVRSGPGLTTGTAAAPADLGTPYVLAVGNLAGHKNLPFLVRAFTAAGREDTRLVIVGRSRGGAPALDEAIAASPARDRIEVRGDATDPELDGLYRGAAAHLFPSRYEGFGFTALEAMGRGCPVLASDIPALREISGDGAELLPLDDEPAWSQAIRRVLADPAWRSELRDRGRATVARFSWDATARGVLEVLREAGG